MDILELIKERKSIRCFKPDIPARELVLECLEAASWAPNPTSQQPWQFIVLTGDTLKKVCDVIQKNYAAAAAQKAQGEPEQPKNDITEILEKRKKDNFAEMMSFLQENNADMQAIGEGNFNFHRAPVAVLFGVWPCKDQNYLKSIVAAMQNFMLMATARGMGTCWANAVSICQDVIKECLNLHEELILVDGVAVGYPVADEPVNKIPRHRLAVEEVTIWHN